MGTGTLPLGFTYTDSAGSPNAGNVSISYSATLSNNVNGAVSPANTITVATHSSQVVTIDFTTDDGQPATNLTNVTGLTAAQTTAGWSITSNPTPCASVSTTGTCPVTLTFAPTVATTAPVAPVSLTYSYVSGPPENVAKTVTVVIPYSAYAGHLYIADGGSTSGISTGGDKVVRCAISPSTGAVSGCATAFSSARLDPRTVVINGGYAYISSYLQNAVYVCPINLDGTLSTCAAPAPSGISTAFFAPEGLTVVNNGTQMIVTNDGGSFVLLCALSSVDGTLSNCTPTATWAASAPAGASFQEPSSVVISGTTAYVADRFYDGSPSTGTKTTNGSVITCTVNPDFTLTGCLPPTTNLTTHPTAMNLIGSTMYVGSPEGTLACTLATPVTLGVPFTACATTGPAAPGDTDFGIAFANGFAYLGDNTGLQAVEVCSSFTGSISGNCSSQTVTSTTIVAPEGITPQ